MALKFGLQEWSDYHPRDDANAPIVLCFGDSWFWYPIPGIGSLTSRFLDFGKHQSVDIVALGKNGMEIASPGKNILFDLTTFFQWEAKTLDMVAISGGGNDFAGPEDLDPLLKKGNSSDVKSWFKQKQLDALFSRIEDGYQRVVHLRDTFSPSIPIVTHCYDYAHATGQGLLWFSPWIKPSLKNIDMPKSLHHKAVKYIIDGLADVQKKLENTCDLFHFVDTRKTLVKDDWSNELHPTAEGFNKVSKPFFPLFEQYFGDWVRKPKWFDR